jgi:hypothetical protein
VRDTVRETQWGLGFAEGGGRTGRGAGLHGAGGEVRERAPAAAHHVGQLLALTLRRFAGSLERLEPPRRASVTHARRRLPRVPMFRFWVCELIFGGKINALCYDRNCLHHDLEVLNNPVPPPSDFAATGFPRCRF